MSTSEKIGQLFMLPVSADYPKAEREGLKTAVAERHIGGIILYKADAKSHLAILRRFQKAAKIPLLVAMDAEWGAAMRITDAVALPRNMTLGAVTDNELVRRAGGEIGRQLRALGVTLNFSPVVDVNNNPQNPVINDRSFGEDPENVAGKGLAFARGLQEAGVIATAKHFPGHGDTLSDSHETLPNIPHDLSRLRSIELLPFQRLIDGGVDAVMTAHLYVPALDHRENRPTSLSSAVVTGLLRRQMGFDGLIITDALQMKAVRNHFQPGDESLEAALAGNDVLLLGSIDNRVDSVLEKYLPEGIRKIGLAVEDGRLPPEELDRRVLRILKMKEALGLHEYPHLGSKDPDSIVAHPKTRALRTEILNAALTMVKNDGGLLPLRGAVGEVAYVDAGAEGGKISMLLSLASKNPLEQTLSARLNLKYYRLVKSADEKRLGKLIRKLENYSTVVVSISGMKRWSSQDFGVTNATRNLLQRLDAKGKKVILVVMGNPYSLREFGAQTAILCAYEDSKEARIAVARVILGELSPQGRLPVTASAAFPAGTGLEFP